MPRRFMALEGMKGYDDKEAAEERLFFKKEDEKLLRKLLNKVKAQADATDVHEAKGDKEAELSALHSIIAKYKMSEDDLEALLKWKHH